MTPHVIFQSIDKTINTVIRCYKIDVTYFLAIRTPLHLYPAMQTLMVVPAVEGYQDTKLRLCYIISLIILAKYVAV